jgi:NADH:ubiquinone oxidoreductase subunit 6 (subunit J)
MSSEWVIWLFESIALIAAIAILITRSVFHAGLYLLVVTLSIGVIYGLYGSEFFFISQILIYGGGILVLIHFATMVTAGKDRPTGAKANLSIPLIILVAGVIVLVTVWVMAYQPIGIPYVVATTSLGNKLLLDYSLPLEVSGILLLVSLIGSAITAIQKPINP